ncbi:lysophospholipid acyltransferase family protein [Legionella cardiaca]|uniref:1-acyl-sn-glycerol-3-phosphate acyltransferase n=1 Tax=Legionella cardiaca TaxID=1071983 RepID=A0ABY8ARQ1_9GAMM|nr:lysophospholipid acyltransferase family protein [Legionella cardiaca]WED43208.1 lysophospholipid acyltransferase family protein [Legionella cardiaca]
MKISKLRTQWIILLSVLYTADACLRSIIKRFTGKTNRAWVDKTIHQWANRLLNLVGVKCKVVNPHGIEPKQGQATIIMCNHSSLYDIPLSFKAFPNHSIRMLAKKELSRIPIMGKGMMAAEFPFIDRKNRHQAIKDLEAVRKLLESGIVMWIAPEGTRSKDGKLAAFKKGAFITAIEAKAIIIPIGIRGAYDILPARTTQININQTAEIHIGAPIDASRYTNENKEELVKLVHQSMQLLVEEQDSLSK